MYMIFVYVYIYNIIPNYHVSSRKSGVNAEHSSCGSFAVNPSASCPGGANARCLLLQQRDQGAEAELVFTKSDVHSV